MLDVGDPPPPVTDIKKKGGGGWGWGGMVCNVSVASHTPCSGEGREGEKRRKEKRLPRVWRPRKVIESGAENPTNSNLRHIAPQGRKI